MAGSKGTAKRGSDTVERREPAIRLKDVQYRRQDRIILDHVDLEIGRGEKWVLFGPNGVGKSTLISMMSTRGFPSSGTVEILGNRLGKVNVFSYRWRIGLASAELAKTINPQEDPYDVVLTAFSDTTGRWREEFTQGQEDAAMQLMDRFGIAYLRGKRMYRLSEGERGRVLICRALMANPDLLILDEPTTGLDLGGRELVLKALSRIGQEDKDRTVVLVTHRLEEIPEGFDKVAMMGRRPMSDSVRAQTPGDPDPGTITFQGPVEEGLTGGRLSDLFGLNLKVIHDEGRWGAFAAARV